MMGHCFHARQQIIKTGKEGCLLWVHLELYPVHASSCGIGPFLSTRDERLGGSGICSDVQQLRQRPSCSVLVYCGVSFCHVRLSLDGGWWLLLL